MTMNGSGEVLHLLPSGTCSCEERSNVKTGTKAKRAGPQNAARLQLAITSTLSPAPPVG